LIAAVGAVAAAGAAAFVRAQTVVGSGGVAAISAPTPSSASSTPEPTATAQGLAAHLTRGLTFRNLGVCESPSAGKPWWQPDGTPLERAPYWTLTAPGQKLPRVVRAESREIAVRVSGLDNNGDTPDILWHPTRGGGWFVNTGPLDQANHVVPGIEGR